jgi:hypothetical protein
MLASRDLREAGKKEEAQAVAKLGEQMLKRLRAQQKRDGSEPKRGGDERKRGDEERKAAGQQIELMTIAVKALHEGERDELAEQLKRAVQARLVRLKGLKGKEAELVLKREPKLGQTVELLNAASRLWREFGDEEKAEAIGQLAEKLGRAVKSTREGGK